MFEKHKGKLLLSSFLTLLPILAGLLLWDRLPDTLAIHWGVSGQADGWSGKAAAIFLPPLLMLATHWLCIWLTLRDPKNRDRNHKMLRTVFWILPISSNFSSGLVLASAMGLEFSVDRLLIVLLGLMFAVLGNYLPKCRMNSTMGIKVPWAYTSEENWNATHRFAGKLWLPGGILVMFCAFFPNGWGMAAMLAVLLVLAVVPAAYSYRFYRKEKCQGKPMVSPLSTTDIMLLKGVAIFVVLLLIGAVFLLFTGSIEMRYGAESFTIEASYYSDLTVKYDAIEQIEYREGNVDGTRTNGLGSFRLLLGFFENKEFGSYTRYTYYNPEACVIISTSSRTIVLSGEDAAATKTIYQELLSKARGISN